MEKVAVILGMIACLVVPTVIFGIVGYKSMETMGRRPSRAGRAIMILILKLAAAAAVLMGILSAITKFYGEV